MNIAANILTELKAKVKRATEEGKAEDFYFDEADREAMKALVSIADADKLLPAVARRIAKEYNFL